MADKFFIAPYDQNSGQQNNVRPWLIPDEAFEELTNAYVFRGRVRKRFGSRWIGDTSLVSRLRVQLGTTVGGTLAGNVRLLTVDTGLPLAVGQSFSVLNSIFTVNNAAFGIQNMLRSDGIIAPATFDLANSAFNITGTGAPDGTPVYFYPGLPVMGLVTFESTSINDETTLAFDQRFAYQYLGGWERIAGETTPGAAHWSGSDSQFFWGTTWTGVSAADKVFFVSNFNDTEPNYMRSLYANLWDNFRPVVDATPNYLNSARILVPFKNRLLAFNTWEGVLGILPGTHYSNRCRYSQIGSPLDIVAWRQDLPGKGNAIDAPTTEAIITVEFIKDRLIVFFERSTWELVYTGNQAYPFSWQQINTELGAESTFSIIPFDKVAIGVGNVGIMACNGANVERIDNQIPSEVFAIHNANQGVERVYGIRDYTVETLYWTFPNTLASTDFPYPTRVLVYNYKTQSWSFFEDSITCFGYFQPTSGVLWSSTTVTWTDTVTWTSGSVQAKFRQVIAGNQQGYTFICDPDIPVNSQVLQITDLTVVANVVTITAINHNLSAGDYIYLEGITSTGNLTILNNGIFQIADPVTPHTFNFVCTDLGVVAGVYSGAGLISRVSNIIIKTKEYNFYAKQGRNAYISKVDFMVDATNAGQTQVDFFVSTASTPLLTDSASNGVLLGSGTLDTFPYTTAESPIPFEATATRLWHPVYFQADGECIQLQLKMNDAQMRSVAVRRSGFELHAMCFSAAATSFRLQ
jgi:hypothetical protein